MRKFKANPQKKLIGMAILFVFVPLFLLWYWVFFLGHKPGTDTMVIIACIAALAAFLCLRYKRQLAKTQAGPAEGEELPEEEPEEDEAESEEEGGEESEFEEGGEEGTEEDEIEEDESEEEGSESEALSEKTPKENKNKKPKKQN